LTQGTTNESRPFFVYDRRLSDHKLLDPIVKSIHKIEITSGRGDEVANLVSEGFQLNGVVRHREGALGQSFVAAISYVLEILRDKVVTQGRLEYLETREGGVFVGVPFVGDFIEIGGGGCNLISLRSVCKS
jgi:hypothetical protein